MHAPGTQFFRAGVGIGVLDSGDRVLALERYDFPGAWQLPQGGLEEGEEPEDAARRELWEETGIRWDQVQLLGEHPRWLAYELDAAARSPDVGRGQVQKWFVVRLIDPDVKVDLSRIDGRKGHPEFRAGAWMTLGDLLEKSARFRLQVYHPVAEYIRSLTASSRPRPR